MCWRSNVASTAIRSRGSMRSSWRHRVWQLRCRRLASPPPNIVGRTRPFGAALAAVDKKQRDARPSPSPHDFRRCCERAGGFCGGRRSGAVVSLAGAAPPAPAIPTRWASRGGLWPRKRASGGGKDCAVSFDVEVSGPAASSARRPFRATSRKASSDRPSGLADSHPTSWHQIQRS